MSADASWLPDPTGRHEQRYWNGNAWTEHVMDATVPSSDPLAAPAAASEAPVWSTNPETASVPLGVVLTDAERRGAAKNRRTGFIVGGALAALLLLVIVVVGAVIAFGSSSSSHEIKGSFLLTDTDCLTGDSCSIDSSGGHCYGSEGYDDIDRGAQVNIKDGSGKLLATGELAGGKRTGGLDAACAFTFVISDVPDAAFYKVEISHRGDISFSKKEMEHHDWHVATSLGS